MDGSDDGLRLHSCIHLESADGNEENANASEENKEGEELISAALILRGSCSVVCLTHNKIS